LKASAKFFVVLLAVARTMSAQEATDPQQLTDLPLEDLLKLKVNTVFSASKSLGPSDLIAAADRALYRAKETGRD
jgi:GGDEF domain-containing protein